MAKKYNRTRRVITHRIKAGVGQDLSSWRTGFAVLQQYFQKQMQAQQKENSPLQTTI